MDTKSYRSIFLFILILILSSDGFAQVKILENQIGIGIPNPTAAIDIRGASNSEASRFQIGNLQATSKIQLLSGRKEDERSFLFFSPQDTFILARHFTDTTEVLRFVPNGGMEARGYFNLRRGPNDNSVYIGPETGTATNGSFSLDNVFVGYFSGRSNDMGSRNTFIGPRTGLSNEGGSFNTFIGNEAGRNNINGIDNTALGTKAGENNTSGSENVFLGNQAGNANTTGNVNIYIGRGAGFSNSAGTLNTFIGSFAGPVPNSGNTLESAIAIGNSAQVDCSYCAVIGGTGAYAVDLGLGVPVPTAKLDVDGTVRIRNLPPGNGNLVVADNEGNLFISAPLPMADNGQASTLEAENQALRTELAAVKERLEQLENIVRDLAARQEATPSDGYQQEAIISGAMLRQNQPNPFRESTRIAYFIPDAVNRAVLKITDARGELLESIPIKGKGQGSTTIRPFALNTGTYFYSLVLDGQISDTRKMIITAN
ncbi:T9SS type A sorting domain-containing protein [Flavilitoribacter nigricans]|uniref:T9SS type A sorting domain-containing protein n=1 Tax=Flavilitoribacter nigricans (strain ATCC 23147 / DSM 23189 / NBRC 102662 / NCIMB 1420 / SS-2) TaxID=1122177 RepID=A0A2D0NJ68_FLAN2|nr:T9SS type A sorting domain-containing protein [Flavilitoribacter nigricans]PHN08497.1 hypothetical protein CRP01_00875 [Flavilitoribacter nigricans DSM 23189 = NBRC 102662]